MQAMLDEVAPKLKIGARMLSEIVRADAREGDIGMQLGEIAKANPEVTIGSYPFFEPRPGANTNVVPRARCTEAPACQTRTCWSECGEHNRIAPELRLPRIPDRRSVWHDTDQNSLGRLTGTAAA